MNGQVKAKFFTAMKESGVRTSGFRSCTRRVTANRKTQVDSISMGSISPPVCMHNTGCVSCGIKMNYTCRFWPLETCNPVEGGYNLVSGK